MSGAPSNAKSLYVLAGILILAGFAVPLWHGVFLGAVLLVYLGQPILALVAALLLDVLAGPSYGFFEIPIFFTLAVVVLWACWSLLKRYLRTRD